MACKLSAERPVLQTYRQMPLRFAPHSHPLERTGEAVLRRLTLDHPAALARFTPDVRKAQKIEAAWTLTPITRALKLHQFRLLRMQRESIFPESLWEYLHYAFRIHFGCAQHRLHSGREKLCL